MHLADLVVIVLVAVAISLAVWVSKRARKERQGEAFGYVYVIILATFLAGWCFGEHTRWREDCIYDPITHSLQFCYVSDRLRTEPSHFKVNPDWWSPY